MIVIYSYYTGDVDPCILHLISVSYCEVPDGEREGRLRGGELGSEGVSRLRHIIYLVGCVFLSEGECRSVSIESPLYSYCTVSRKGGWHTVNLSLK